MNITSTSIRRAAAAAAAMAITLSVATHAGAQVCGDVTADDQVRASDALAVLRKAVGQDVELICTDQCAVLEPRIAALEELLSDVSKVGDNLVVSGANLQVVDGSGSTAGPPNGRGNLIVGYNEDDQAPAAVRTGSHNIIVGRENGYSSYGGLVAGFDNTVAAPMASVTGGNLNFASGAYSSVCGGYANEASGEAAAVGGGDFNLAAGLDSSVSGGRYNDALDEATSVTGGSYNQATALMATVSGGTANAASGAGSSVSGGTDNEAAGLESSVSGGRSNLANDDRASVTGGYYNTASGMYSSVSGGNDREVTGLYDWRAGGSFQDE